MSTQIMSSTATRAAYAAIVGLGEFVADTLFALTQLREAHRLGLEAGRLMAMSDAQLEARGLTRDTIAVHVYRNF